MRREHVMTPRDKAFEVAKKIYELFKGGVDGEKDNARVAFERICKQHDFAESDFDDEFVSEFVIKYKNQMEMKLVSQVACMCKGVIGTHTFMPYRRELVLNLARKDYINAMIHVDMLLPHFRREFDKGMDRFRERLKFWRSPDMIGDYGARICLEYQKEIKAEISKFRRHFASAFIMKHDIYPPVDENGNHEFEDEDENELGQKLLGNGSKRKRREGVFDYEAFAISQKIERMAVRTRISNGNILDGS